MKRYIFLTAVSSFIIVLISIPQMAWSQGELAYKNKNRAEFIKMVITDLKLPLEEPSKPSFRDVRKSSNYYSFIETAKKHGFITVPKSRKFYPERKANHFFISKVLTRVSKFTSAITSQNQPPQNQETSLFLAYYKKPPTYDLQEFTIAIYDLLTRKMILSKEISFDAVLGDSSANTMSVNEAVQYNPKTKDIFFSTFGVHPYTGNCINKDKTCLTRIYRINFNDTKPTMIYQSDPSHQYHWMVNSFDNSILVDFVSREGEGVETVMTQTIKKIDAYNGEVIFSKTYSRKAYVEFAEFALSSDGQFTYQSLFETYFEENNIDHHILKLQKINNVTGDMQEEEISQNSLSTETNLSPDNRYFAFYQRKATSPSLYDLSTKKTIVFPEKAYSVTNLNLLWSSDSTKLFYVDKDKKIAHYQITSINDSPLMVEGQPISSIVGKYAASKYFVFQPSPQINLQLYDIEKDKIISLLTEKIPFVVKGLLGF